MSDVGGMYRAVKYVSVSTFLLRCCVVDGGRVEQNLVAKGRVGFIGEICVRLGNVVVRQLVD